MSAEPGWYDDPIESSQYRYWDGERWTENVRDKASVVAVGSEAAVETPWTSSLETAATVPETADATVAASILGAAAGESTGTPPWARSSEDTEASGAGDAFGTAAAFGAGAGAGFGTADASIPSEPAAAGNEPLFGAHRQTDQPVHNGQPTEYGQPFGANQPVQPTEYGQPFQPAGAEQPFGASQPFGAEQTPQGSEVIGAVPGAFAGAVPGTEPAPLPTADSAGGPGAFVDDASYFERPTSAVTFETDEPTYVQSEPSQTFTGVGGLRTPGDRSADDMVPPEEISPEAIAMAASLDASKAKKVKKAKAPKEKVQKDPSKSDSKLPILLGLLALVLIGAGAYLLLTGGDDGADTDVAGTTVTSQSSPTTAVPTTAVATSEAAPTTTPSAVETIPASSAAPSTPAGIDPSSPEAMAMRAAFDAESARACAAIQANPGLYTESVIVFDETWRAIGLDYEQLQRSVNECSFAAREEALRNVEQYDQQRG
ncbi:MAG: DUF2510 domain-containing protein [Microthrixaceae bacterium]|nr:DUF2510 domain-containing protein [Microthrixaceae bacterium]